MGKDIIGDCLLDQLLEVRNMSQAELSEITGLHKTQISQYVTNKRIMNLNNAFIIARALRCPIEHLYSTNE